MAAAALRRRPADLVPGLLARPATQIVPRLLQKPFRRSPLIPPPHPSSSTSRSPWDRLRCFSSNCPWDRLGCSCSGSAAAASALPSTLLPPTALSIDQKHPRRAPSPPPPQRSSHCISSHWGRARCFSSGSAAAAASPQPSIGSAAAPEPTTPLPPTTLLPITELVDPGSDDWLDYDEYVKFLKKEGTSLVLNQFNNILIPNADAVKGPFDLSRIGQLIGESLNSLVLWNCNRGCSIAEALRKENIKVHRKLHQVGLKEAKLCILEGVVDRPACYSAACDIFESLLTATEGPDILVRLSWVVADYLYTMKYPGDERLIHFHPAAMCAEGKGAFNEKIFRLVCRQWTNSRASNDHRMAYQVLMCQLYCDTPTEWPLISSKYPLLDEVLKRHSGKAPGRLALAGTSHMPPSFADLRAGARIEAAAASAISAAAAAAAAQVPPGTHPGPIVPSAVVPISIQLKLQQLHDHSKYLTAWGLIGHQRHVPVHLFDPHVVNRIMGPVNKTGNISIPYSFADGMGCVTAAFSKFQKGALESFAALKVLDELEMEHFFPKVFGSIPIPDYSVFDAHWSAARREVLEQQNPPQLRQTWKNKK